MLIRRLAEEENGVEDLFSSLPADLSFLSADQGGAVGDLKVKPWQIEDHTVGDAQLFLVLQIKDFAKGFCHFEAIFSVAQLILALQTMYRADGVNGPQGMEKN